MNDALSHTYIVYINGNMMHVNCLNVYWVFHSKTVTREPNTLPFILDFIIFFSATPSTMSGAECISYKYIKIIENIAMHGVKIVCDGKCEQVNRAFVNNKSQPQ